MDSLYERLLEKKFLSSRDAIEFCRESCVEYGFDIQKETSDNRSIYLQCLYEHLSVDGRETPTLRKRPSSLKDTDCPWRIIVTKNELSEWVMKKPSNASEHNHPVNNDWPQEVYNKINQLARQKNLTTDEIRETVKLQFPHITWNDRRFLNCLKRIPQNSTTERVQRLIMASTRLCSVVAANEDWANCVEGDLVKLLESYAQLTRVSAHQLDSMVDLELDMIHSEIEKTARRSKPEEIEMPKQKKSINMSKDVQVMSIPSCTLYVRSQPLRSMSEPSSQNRRTFSDMNSSSIPQPPMTSFGVGSLFSLTSPVSSPSSTSSIQQRMDYIHRSSSGNNDMLQSPPIPDFSLGSSNSSGNNSHYNSTMYPMQPSYSAYTPSSSSYQSGDMNFFDSNSMGNNNYLHRPQPASPGNYQMGNYYNVRDQPSIQQRIMLQQEYEQHQRHLQQMESRNTTNQLPIIRNTGMNLVQQHNNQPNTWS